VPLRKKMLAEDTWLRKEAGEAANTVPPAGVYIVVEAIR
jgi:hypothetical protein